MLIYNKNIKKIFKNKSNAIKLYYLKIIDYYYIYTNFRLPIMEKSTISFCFFFFGRQYEIGMAHVQRTAYQPTVTNYQYLTMH